MRQFYLHRQTPQSAFAKILTIGFGFGFCLVTLIARELSIGDDLDDGLGRSHCLLLIWEGPHDYNLAREGINH